MTASGQARQTRPSTGAGPEAAVAGAGRIAVLDVLRGFALGGILAVNILGMANLFNPGSTTAADLVHLVFEGKFYILFSFLFGYSFTLQLRAAERDGTGGTARTLRRCAALIVIGGLHMVLLWLGDILLAYGIAGLALLTLRRLRPRTAAIVASALLIGVAVLSLLAGGTGPSQPAAATQARLLDSYRDTFLSAAQTRLELLDLAGGVELPLLTALGVLPYFLYGLAAGRARLLEHPSRYRHLLSRLQWLGYGLGGTATVAINVAAWNHWLAKPVIEAIDVLAAPLLALGYAATVLRLAPRLAWLAPAGTIAASNYLGQSAITAVLFTGAGFALASRLPDGIVLVIAAAVYAAQLAVSRWWTRRHRYGPVEWILRTATYGPRRTRSDPSGRARD